MIVRELMHVLNQEVPFKAAESWDNVGLLIGDEEQHVTGILTTLDCTEAVALEAIKKECNVIICHHPLIFSGIKSIQNEGYGKVIMELIKHDIALIAMHTNLDAHPQGVSYMIAQQLGLRNIEVLLNQEENRSKLQFYVPASHASVVKAALSAEGAGIIGDYDSCFYETEGKGQFRPLDNAEPFIGQSGQLEIVEELKIECVFQPHLRSKIEAALLESHPYEEPAYEILDFKTQSSFGTGVKGTIEAINLESLAKDAKEKLMIGNIKMIGNKDKQIETVAIIGGAGMDYAAAVKQTGADVFITGDIKYHEAHDLLMMGLAALDITHYAECIMKEGLRDLLKLDVPIMASEVDTNPFQNI